jgi:multidrug efflux pump subunit AcrA (membrane-fusion protein)
VRKIRKRRMAVVMVLCVGLLSGCAGKPQTDDLVITIPEYEKITYTTEPVVHGDIAPVLDLRLKSEQFERKEYYPDHDEMEVDQVFVHVGDVVQNGDTLVTFSSEDITEERRQYENRVEEDALLIDHYTKLDAINQTDEHQESIEQLKKDQEIAGLYIKDLDARLEAYTIKAEGSGIVSSLSDMLDYGTVYAGDAVVTILYGSDNYTTTTEDDYAFEVGQTFTATFGVGSYEVRLTAIDVLASDTDAGMKRQLTFTLVDSAKRPSSDSLNLEIEKNVLKNVLYVPEDAIVYVGNDNYVYVLDEDGFRHGVQVQTGATIDGYTVIEDGLKEGDKVVIAK